MSIMPRLPSILLTNDDGFDAPGLRSLEKVAQEFADEIWIVAPEHDQSGTGQSLSIHTPLRCWSRGERRWAVAGTPADCVGLALAELMGNIKPALILSGINAGSNVGDEVNMSGTLGAAFMGLMMGTPALALSQDCEKRSDINWTSSEQITKKMLAHFLTHGWRKDTCLSINIPQGDVKDIKGFSWARQCHKNVVGINIDKREDKRYQHYYWLTTIDKIPAAKDNSDFSILQGHEVSVTTLGLDRSLDVAEPSILFDESSPND